MRAVLFGSIGTLAETSDLQRRAFNKAFAEAGLDWVWSSDTYQRLLIASGGRDRIARFARQRDVQVDAGALHQRKSEIFQALLRSQHIDPRPGVLDTISKARTRGMPLALVTTTSAQNVSDLLNALVLDKGIFDVVIHAGLVTSPKPATDAYALALDMLGLTAADAVAIEDNPDGISAATGAGIRCIGFPGQLHRQEDVKQNVEFQTMLDLEGALLNPDQAAA